MDLFGNVHQSHGPSTWRPEEMFVDTRQFGYSNGTSDNSSRFVKLSRATPDGGAIARSKEHDKLVVVGRQTIRLITVTDTKHHLQAAQSYETPPKGNASQSRATGPGGAIAEIGPNYWSTKFPPTMLLTDVTWGPQEFSNKIFTSCTNGEVRVWDFGKGGLKFESTLPGGGRSVNVVKAANFSSYSLATGSTDGSVKLWDLRMPTAPAFNLGGHGSAVRSMTFGQVPTHPVHVVFGLEAGAIFRYDLRLGIAYLDRVPAHSRCVHDLAWLPPTKDEANVGYLASGSFDHTVKVWNIDSTRIGMQPLHTIHTPYPVGKLGWRPFYDTEVLVIPYHGGWTPAKPQENSETRFDSNEKYAPQIWDVRKGWLAKWQLPTIDGPVTDVAFNEGNAAQVVYKSGAFAQLDLREATRPVDTIGRHALSWNANSSLFFVADPVPLSEPPYDDLHPGISAMLGDYGLADKRPGDRLGVATTQVLGAQFVFPDLDRESYMKLARGYNHHDEDKVRMCKRNEDVATRAGQHEVAQTWALLGSLLSEFKRAKNEEVHRHSINLPPETPLSANPSAPTKEPQSGQKSFSRSPPIIAHHGTTNPIDFTLDGVEIPAAATKRKGSGGSSLLLGVMPGSQRRRESSPSMLTNLRPPMRSPSSSPISKLAKLPSSNTGVNAVGSVISRHFLARRMSRSSSSNSPGPGAAGIAEQKQAWKTYVNAGEGALEDSSSEEEEGAADDSDERVVHSEASMGASWTQERSTLTTLNRQHPTLHSSSSSNRSSPAIGSKRLLPSPHLTSTLTGLLSGSSPKGTSPQTQLLDIQDVTEDSGEESDETDEDDDGSRSAESRQRRSGSSEDDGRAGSQNGIDVPGDSRVKFDPPSPTLAKYTAKSNESSRTATMSRGGGLRALTKQESTSSMATAYQMGSVDLATSPSYGASSITPTMGTVRISALVRKDTDQTISLNDVIESSESSARRVKGPGDSPSAKPLSLRNLFDPLAASTSTTSPSAAVPTRPPLPRTMSHGATLNRATHGTLMSNIASMGSTGLDQSSFNFGLATDKEEETSLSQAIVHDLEEKEKTAMFDVVKDMLEMYAEEGNVQMCAALAMAAHEQLEIDPERLESFVLTYMDQLVRMRLHLNAAYVRQSAPIPSIVESTALDVFIKVNCGRCGKGIDATRPAGVPGRFAYCEHCKKEAIRCAICHLPVRRMLFFCHTCGHGGHHRCYQQFYSQHSLIDLQNPRSKFPYTPYEEPRPAVRPQFGPRVNSTRASSVDNFSMEDDQRTDAASPAPRGRKRDVRRGISEVDSPETIPERDVAQFSSTASTSSTHGGLSHKEGSRRSQSAAESTIVDDDRLMPEEEHILVREREAEQRLAARRNMHLFAHPCAAGCGHFCWMAKD